MLEEKLYQDYVKALKGGDKPRSGFLSFVRSELKNIAINLRKDKLEDNEVISALSKQKKRLQETKESITSSGREDLAQDLEQAENELSILDEYLPKALDESELAAIIDSVISEVGASSIKDMGKVMKEVTVKTAGRADGKQVSNLVRSKLSSE